MVRLNVLFVSLLVAGLGTAPTVSAQAAEEMSVEELTAAFKKQKTRGLVIVPNAAADATTDVAAQETATVAAVAAEEYEPVERQAQVNVPISFDFDSAALRADQQPKLVKMCQAMQLLDGTVFQIIGHTDSSGSASYNQRLSLLRAQEVRRHLISDCGIDGSMLNAIGMGETAPFDDNDTRGDINRRVEFQALG